MPGVSRRATLTVASEGAAGSAQPGHLGLRGRVLFSEHWGAAADLQVGSAYVGKVSLVYALGGER